MKIYFISVPPMLHIYCTICRYF